MNKGFINRLDAENIVNASVDTDSHAVTGEVYDSINDEHYPIGGGGADIKVLHATINNNSGSVVIGGLGSLPYSDGKFSLPYTYLAVDATITDDFVYTYDEGSDEYAIYPSGSAKIASYSNNVNCTVEGVNTEESVIKITDPSQDASITVNLAQIGGSNG